MRRSFCSEKEPDTEVQSESEGALKKARLPRKGGPLMTEFFEDGRLQYWPEEASIPIDQFLEHFLPSATPALSVSWIQVHRRKSAGGDVAGEEGGLEVEQLEQIVSEGKPILTSSAPPKDKVAKLTDLAHRTRCLVGKWLIYRTKTRVDDTWAVIAKATVDGKLGSSSKVAVCPGDSHVICVYTPDFSKKDDILKVRKALRELGFAEKISYKPDLYTYLDIYSGNPFGMRPTLHYM